MVQVLLLAQMILLVCLQCSASSYRPKDLSTIKRHIENGTIRTTAEFQHDMMLMFTNAIMYNSSNHNVYRMAVDMYDDVLQQIEVS